MPRTQSQCPEERESSTASLVLSVPAHTLGRLGDHWACSCKNIVGPLRRVMSLPLLLQNIIIFEAGHQVKGIGDRLPPSHPDMLPAGVLAHPTRSGPSQQREGPHARTLCYILCWTDIPPTHFLVHFRLCVI